MNVYNVQVGLARTKNSTLYTFCSPLPPGKSCFTEITAITPLYLNIFTGTFSNHPLSKGFLEPWGFVCGHLTVTLAVVAVTAATAAACVC